MISVIVTNMKILVLISLVTHIKCAWHIDAPPIAIVSPCPANYNITAIYISDKAPEDENKYDVKFKSKLPNYSQVSLQFDSEATIKLEPPSSKAARVTTSGKSFQITFFKNSNSLDFQVSGPHIGVIPYITGFYVNGDEYCSNALVVYQITVHEDFTYRSLASDLALLKLKVEAAFDDYVQPACVWHEKISERISSDVTGSVVGWGIDESENLSTKLRQATMPIVSEAKCIERNPLFYSKVLDDRKFCAGLENGTSACNGDSGGGFQVFIPDKDDEATGAWYIRGIVSLSAYHSVDVRSPSVTRINTSYLLISANTNNGSINM